MDNERASLYQAAIRFLAGRDHSRAELRRKLLARNAVPERVDGILDELEGDGYLSDRRFAESWLRSRIGRGQGPLRIRRDLAEKGVADTLIEEAFESVQDDWDGLLRQVHDRKFGDTPCADERDMARRARFLAYRGFASADIYRLLRRS